jgi:Rieske 2Fe-2S family protein
MVTTFLKTTSLSTQGAVTLPQRDYMSMAVFREEQEHIFASRWLCIGREEQVATPGRYMLVEIGLESLIVVRDRKGTVRALYNVCRHRGTRLCEEPGGELSETIQCPYHAWTYGLDGRLLSAPLMEKVVGFREEEHALGRVATAVWDGHVFVNLAPRPLPFAQHLAGLDRKFAPWGMGALRRAERRRYRLKANWKLVIQNYSECLHCPLAHPLLNKQSHYMSGDNEPPQPTYLGGSMELREGVKTLSLDGQTNREALPGLCAADRRRVYYYALLPNLLLNLHPDYMLTFQVWPIAVDRTEVVCAWHFHPDEMAKPGFDPNDAVAFWDLTNQQDWELSDRAQQGISTLGYRPGPYSNREELLLAFDRFVLGRLARTD